MKTYIVGTHVTCLSEYMLSTHNKVLWRNKPKYQHFLVERMSYLVLCIGASSKPKLYEDLVYVLKQAVHALTSFSINLYVKGCLDCTIGAFHMSIPSESSLFQNEVQSLNAKPHK